MELVASSRGTFFSTRGERGGGGGRKGRGEGEERKKGKFKYNNLVISWM